MAAKTITFNGFSLQDSNFRTKDILYRTCPMRTLDLEPLARTDGYRLVNSYYGMKDIRVSGTVTADTEAALRTLVDNMKRALDGTEKTLVIDDGGTNVQWTGSVASIDVPEEHFHITRIPYSIVFRCQPFGTSAIVTTSTNSIVDTSSKSGTVVVIGSASPKPTLKWEVVGSPSAAITGISFVNSTTADTFGVTGLSLVGNGDYLQLNTSTMSAVYNTGSGNVEVDFTGVIPSFTTSTNSYSVTVTGGGASRTILQTLTYNASYL